MKRTIVAALLVSGLLSAGFAEDLTHRIGVTGLAQAGIPLGQQSVVDQAKDAGPILGGMVSYGLSKHWGVGASYENYDVGNGVNIRVEPVILQAMYRFCPESTWTPVLLAGGGISRGVDAKNFNHAAAKAGLGVDFFLTPQIALTPQANFYYVANSKDSPRHLSALGAGLGASYYFGGKKQEKAAAPAPAPVAQTPPPPPAAVAPVAIALVLSPASSELGPGQSEKLNLQLSGTDNQAVTWAINPPLGTITQNGLYTAPATIALAEKVTVTATSVADPSRSATSVIQLIPPAAAPQQVSIQINVLFDSGKAVVKPDYDPEIQKVADFMKQYPSAHAEIEGHTDSSGDAAMNMELSQHRADAVRDELIQRFGIAGDRLTAKGYGETKPIGDNKTAAGRKQNRRVIATLSATK